MDTVVVPFEKTSLLFSRAAPPNSRLRLCVIIPVRNEALDLENTLTALAHQVNVAGNPIDADVYEVLLLANNCTDDSAAIAHRYRRTFPAFNLHVEEITIPSGKSTIGHVRRMLMDEAFNRLQTAGSVHGIIASTDGDTVVDRQWVHQIITEMEKGNDAVGGRILTQPANHPVRVYHLRDVMYRTLLAKAETVLDPLAHDGWPKHFQYFGANFAVTCKAYLRAGRMPPLAFLEDAAFYQALLRVDAKVRKSNAVKVYTSTRFCGKVEVGFSKQLQRWNEMAQQEIVQTVESIEVSLVRYENRFVLRRYWEALLQNNGNAKELQIIARKLSLPVNWLASEIKTSLYFGQLWHQVEAKMAEGEPAVKDEPIPIRQAIDELRLFLQKHCTR